MVGDPDASVRLLALLLRTVARGEKESWMREVTQEALSATGSELAVLHLRGDGVEPAVAARADAPDASDLVRRVRRLSFARSPEGVVELGGAAADVAVITRDPPAILALRLPPAFDTRDELLQLLNALVPTIRAALLNHASSDSDRAELVELVESFPRPSLLCDGSGRTLHVNSALLLIEQNAAGPTLIRGVMERVGRVIGMNTAEGATDPQSGTTTIIEAGDESYRIRAQLLPSLRWGSERAIVVSAEPLPSSPGWEISAASVSERFELSRRRAETAVLIASGRTNAEIAEHLGVSVFTVQKHVRAVLDALSVARRGQVRSKLLGDSS